METKIVEITYKADGGHCPEVDDALRALAPEWGSGFDYRSRTRDVDLMFPSEGDACKAAAEACAILEGAPHVRSFTVGAPRSLV